MVEQHKVGNTAGKKKFSVDEFITFCILQTKYDSWDRYLVILSISRNAVITIVQICRTLKFQFLRGLFCLSKYLSAKKMIEEIRFLFLNFFLSKRLEK